MWSTVDEAALDAVGLDRAGVPGALHAAEHASIGLLPLFATCDRWDIGGVSTALHPDTGLPTVFVYDGAPRRRRASPSGATTRCRAGSRATRDGDRRPASARAGCPSCVQSPKCGNGNEPLDKAGAVRLLDVVLNAFGDGVRLR